MSLKVLFALLAAGCGGTGPTPASPTPVASAAPEHAAAPVAAAEPESPPMVSDELRVLLPKEAMSGFAGAASATYFEPTQAEIKKLEAALPAMIRAELKGQAVISPPLWERVNTYKRQYVPFVEAGGARFIWGNFMCTNPGRPGSDTWRKKVVRPDHGGDCFFSVEYSPDTGKFRKFAISGDE
ncbi:MAG: hypothetical protein IPI67_17620 [Myxococcales bacterium]|nr:hypothetical protein [Myxococcales bacterium]